MVAWFTTTYNNTTWQIYMGRDKFENEELIKFGIPDDIWFHVDDLSSAHVYLVCPPGFTISSIPEQIVQDCAQIVKDNSIEGCKKSSVKIVYTPWDNLHKRGDMDIGQIGFHDTSRLKHVKVTKKNEIVNRISKTRVEHDTRTIRERHAKYHREQRNVITRAKRAQQTKEKERKADKAEKNVEELEFANLFLNTDNCVSNQNQSLTAEEYENDFI